MAKTTPGLAGAVPGVLTFFDLLPAPPDARRAFVAGFGFVAALVWLALLLRRDKFETYSRNRTVTFMVVTAVVAFASVGLYWRVGALTVREHWFHSRPDTVFIPLVPSAWASKRVDTLVACARIAEKQGSCPGVSLSDKYGPAEVTAAIERYGEGEILDGLSSTGLALSGMLLFFLGGAFVIFLTLAFGVPALVLARQEGVVDSRDPVGHPPT